MSDQFDRNIREIHARIKSANERARRQLDGRRPTLAPEGQAFRNATEMLASLPARQFPVCGQCGGHVKLGGMVDDAGAWFHDLCWERANGRRR